MGDGLQGHHDRGHLGNLERRQVCTFVATQVCKFKGWALRVSAAVETWNAEFAQQQTSCGSSSVIPATTTEEGRRTTEEVCRNRGRIHRERLRVSQHP